MCTPGDGCRRPARWRLGVTLALVVLSCQGVSAREAESRSDGVPWLRSYLSQEYRPLCQAAIGHVVIITPHAGRAIVAEDVDDDGLADTVAVLDHVVPAEDVPTYDGPGSVERNRDGLTLIVQGPRRALTFALLQKPGAPISAAPVAPIGMPLRTFAVLVLDEYPAPMPLSALADVFERGPEAACSPHCARWSEDVSWCDAACKSGCAACGRWQGVPRCVCVPLASDAAPVW